MFCSVNIRSSLRSARIRNRYLGHSPSRAVCGCRCVTLAARTACMPGTLYQNWGTHCQLDGWDGMRTTGKSRNAKYRHDVSVWRPSSDYRRKINRHSCVLGISISVYTTYAPLGAFARTCFRSCSDYVICKKTQLLSSTVGTSERVQLLCVRLTKFAAHKFSVMSQCCPALGARVQQHHEINEKIFLSNGYGPGSFKSSNLRPSFFKAVCFCSCMLVRSGNHENGRRPVSGIHHLVHFNYTSVSVFPSKSASVAL